MSYTLISKFKRFIALNIFGGLRSSYSQSGEDIIICDLFVRIGIKKPTYLDIGTNEPKILNNTYRLYKRGSRGVCVEPNPFLCNKIKRTRSADICINAGVAFNNQSEADFYLFEKELNGLSTFSKEEAEFWENIGNDGIGKHKPEKVIRLPLVNINDIIATHFIDHPNLISIDVEGLDFEILKMIDYKKSTPEVFCVETLGFIKGNKEIKKREIVDYLEDKGYFIFADTYINTIFCHKKAYKKLA